MKSCLRNAVVISPSISMYMVVQNSLVLELTFANIATNRLFRTDRVVIEVDRTVSSISLHKLLKGTRIVSFINLSPSTSSFNIVKRDVMQIARAMIFCIHCKTSQCLTAFAFESHSRFSELLHQALFSVWWLPSQLRCFSFQLCDFPHMKQPDRMIKLRRVISPETRQSQP